MCFRLVLAEKKLRRSGQVLATVQLSELINANMTKKNESRKKCRKRRMIFVEAFQRKLSIRSLNTVQWLSMHDSRNYFKWKSHLKVITAKKCFAHLLCSRLTWPRLCQRNRNRFIATKRLSVYQWNFPFSFLDVFFLSFCLRLFFPRKKTAHREENEILMLMQRELCVMLVWLSSETEKKRK